jgi:hypothetical protein
MNDYQILLKETIMGTMHIVADTENEARKPALRSPFTIWNDFGDTRIDTMIDLDDSDE